MDISDLEQYKRYMAEAPAKVKAFGGEYLVRGGRHEVLEGDWQPRAWRCCASRATNRPRRSTTTPDSTQDVRKPALGATAYFNMVLVEGVAAPGLNPIYFTERTP
jgi:uncharacterized protein (DUF1330 family)